VLALLKNLVRPWTETTVVTKLKQKMVVNVFMKCVVVYEVDTQRLLPLPWVSSYSPFSSL